MTRLALAFLLCVPLSAYGQEKPDTKSVVVFPVGPLPEPLPTPVLRTTTLSPGELYVIRSDVKCTVVASPEGVVAISQESGPLRIRAVFTDTGSKFVTRTFTEKNLWLLEAQSKGTTEIIVVVDGSGQVIRKKLIVTGGPLPPIPPDPDPIPPDPKPKPPIPGEGLKVLLTYESGDLSKMTLAQLTALNSANWRMYVKGKGGEWRAYDKDLGDASKDAQWVQDALKRPRTGTPWIVISNGQTGYEGPVPANLDDLMALLKKYGEK